MVWFPALFHYRPRRARPKVQHYRQSAQARHAFAPERYLPVNGIPLTHRCRDLG
jgi:hypothetical protein